MKKLSMIILTLASSPMFGNNTIDNTFFNAAKEKVAELQKSANNTASSLMESAKSAVNSCLESETAKNVMNFANNPYTQLSAAGLVGLGLSHKMRGKSFSEQLGIFGTAGLALALSTTLSSAVKKDDAGKTVFDPKGLLSGLKKSAFGLSAFTSAFLAHKLGNTAYNNRAIIAHAVQNPTETYNKATAKVNHLVDAANVAEKAGAAKARVVNAISTKYNQATDKWNSTKMYAESLKSKAMDIAKQTEKTLSEIPNKIGSAMEHASSKFSNFFANMSGLLKQKTDNPVVESTVYGPANIIEVPVTKSSLDMAVDGLAEGFES